jgi:hypothetical protein
MYEIDENAIDGITWEEKYKNNPITKQFYKMFGGQFMGNSEDGGLFYENANWKSYVIFDNEIEFGNKLSQSVKQGKNLFLTTSK